MSTQLAASGHQVAKTIRMVSEVEEDGGIDEAWGKGGFVVGPRRGANHRRTSGVFTRRWM